MKSIREYEKYGRILKFRCVMRSLSNRYIAKSRLYNVSFKGLRIINTNFKGSIITHSSFKNAIISNCEFLGTNLSRCNFGNAVIRDCIFMGAKLKGTNFKNACFTNVLFVTQGFDECKNINFSIESNKIIKKIENIELSGELRKQIDLYHEISKDRITHILKFNNAKYNFLHISILLKLFDQNQLSHAIEKIIEKKDFDIPTIFALKKSCEKQLNVLL